MQVLVDLLPVIVFFIAFKLWGIYPATAAAMFVSAAQVSAYRIIKGHFEKMQLIVLVLILFLGGLTLLLHNAIFIKWKPSVVNWIFGIVFLSSHFIGKKPLIHHLIEGKLHLPENVLARVNISWGVFFILMGFANLYVVYHFSTAAWVNFKLFGILGLTVLFAIGQAIYIGRYIKDEHA